MKAIVKQDRDLDTINALTVAETVHAREEEAAAGAASCVMTVHHQCIHGRDMGISEARLTYVDEASIVAIQQEIPSCHA